MATTAPFVKLLRQLSAAKDEYRSGALDLVWDGGKASLYLVFGQPNHATYEADDGTALEGPDALAALLHNLPNRFAVEKWRKAVSRTQSLSLSLDELMAPFAALAGAASPVSLDDSANTTALEFEATGAGFDFGLEDFPLLPQGESLWSDSALNVIHLDLRIPQLPTSLIVLSGTKLRAAAVVIRGQIVDAVWVDEDERAAGEGAAMALMGASEGTVSAYQLEDDMAEALTMLWRCPMHQKDIAVEWLDADNFVNRITSEGVDCALTVNGPERGLAFFMGGHFVGAYTQSDRIPSRDSATLVSLLSQTSGTVSVQRRAVSPALSSPRSLPPITGVAIPQTFYSDPSPVVEPPVEAADPERAELPAAAEALPQADEETAASSSHDVPMAQLADSPEYLAEALDPDAQPPPEEAAGDWMTPGANWAQPPVPEETSADTPDVDNLPDPEIPAEAQPESTYYIPPANPEVSESEEESPEVPGFQHFGNEAYEVPQPAESESQTASWVTQLAAATPVEAAPDAGFEATTGTTQHESWQTPSTPSPAPAVEATSAPYPSAIGSEYSDSGDGIDYNAIKTELIQIGVLWLGNDDVAPIAELIKQTAPMVDDFVATIDTIKEMSIPGHDPSVIRAMAREMHYHAAECLSGV